MVRTKSEVRKLCIQLLHITLGKKTSSCGTVSHGMTSLLLMVQGGDLTTISETTTEAMANAVLIIVRPQKSWMQMPGWSSETFHGQRQKTVTVSNEQLQAVNKYKKKKKQMLC